MSSDVDRHGRRFRVVAVIALAGLFAACGKATSPRDDQAATGARPPAEASSKAQGALADLGDLGDLQRRFNQDAGVPRLILLLSPT